MEFGHHGLNGFQTGGCCHVIANEPNPGGLIYRSLAISVSMGLKMASDILRSLSPKLHHLTTPDDRGHEKSNWPIASTRDTGIISTNLVQCICTRHNRQVLCNV